MPFEGLCVRMKDEISRETSIYEVIIYIAVFIYVYLFIL